jgi:putative transposase
MKSPKIVLSTLQRKELEKLSKQSTARSRDKERANIILRLSSGISCLSLCQELGLNWRTVRRCLTHWQANSQALSALETKIISEKGKLHHLRKALITALSDAPRAGCPSKFSAEQYCQLLAVALERPEDSGHEVTHWSLNILKTEVEKRGIVSSISRAQLGAFLKSSRCETTQNTDVALS